MNNAINFTTFHHPTRGPRSYVARAVYYNESTGTYCTALGNYAAYFDGRKGLHTVKAEAAAIMEHGGYVGLAVWHNHETHIAGFKPLFVALKAEAPEAPFGEL